VSDSESQVPLAEVGRYARLADARERALVASARELPHWIERDGDQWVLLVELQEREAVMKELALFEAEQRERPPAAPAAVHRKIETLSLFVAGWILSTFFFAQSMLGDEWADRGAAGSREIVEQGGWWRTITALTLHADLPHVVMNIATGLLFAAFVLPQLGTGFTWLAIVLSGALGNAINAWGYRGSGHASIGASTAVFGALGLLVGLDFIARFSSPNTRSRWQLIVPLGAGFALLAFLGVGEEHSRTDHMAHLWGFAAGIAEGAAAGWLRIGDRAPRNAQRIAAGLAVALPLAAWGLATR
jgi:membrane associated rhomboid family serine protease